MLERDGAGWGGTCDGGGLPVGAKGTWGMSKVVVRVRINGAGQAPSMSIACGGAKHAMGAK